MTFFISTGVAASLARHYDLDPLATGLLALMSFLLVAAPIEDGKLVMTYFGGPGIFTALITAIYSTEVYAFLKA